MDRAVGLLLASLPRKKRKRRRRRRRRKKRRWTRCCSDCGSLGESMEGDEVIRGIRPRANELEVIGLRASLIIVA